MKRRRSKPPSVSGRSVGKGDQRLLDALLARLRSGTDVRRQKVRRLRASMRERTYVNSLKLDIAADRLADELLG